MPGTVASVSFTDSKGFPAQVIFREQLISILVVVGVGKQIHPGPVVEHTVSVADAVGNQLGLNSFFFMEILFIQTLFNASIVPL